MDVYANRMPAQGEGEERGPNSKEIIDQASVVFHIRPRTAMETRPAGE